MSCKLLDAPLLRYLDLIALQRLLLALSSAVVVLIKLELLLVVRAQVANERVEVIEFTLVLRVVKLLLVHLHRRVDLSDLLEEVRDLLLLSLELAVLLIEIVDDPDGVFVELIRVLMLAVEGNHWHIIQLASKHLENFDDLSLGILFSEKHRILVDSLNTPSLLLDL